MADLGLPRCLVAWFRTFLLDQQACIQTNGQLGGYRCVREGTPRGAVMSPLLLQLFINDIAQNSRQEWRSPCSRTTWPSSPPRRPSPRRRRRRRQTALFALLKWVDVCKMDVSAEKTIATVFTLDPHKDWKEVRLFLGDSKLRHEPALTFLGVTFDRTLSFRQHILNLKTKVARRCNALRAVSRKAWGANTTDLRALYVAYMRACAEYAAAGWMSGVVPVKLERLEVVQRQACQIITGYLRSTPVLALRREADLMPFAVWRR